jgi:hypothetical protein
MVFFFPLLAGCAPYVPHVRVNMRNPGPERDSALTVIRDLQTICLAPLEMSHVRRPDPDAEEDTTVVVEGVPLSTVEGTLREILTGIGLTLVPVGDTCGGTLNVSLIGQIARNDYLTSGLTIDEWLVGAREARMGAKTCWVAWYGVSTSLRVIEHKTYFANASNVNRFQLCPNSPRFLDFDERWQWPLLMTLIGYWPGEATRSAVCGGTNKVMRTEAKCEEVVIPQ